MEEKRNWPKCTSVMLHYTRIQYTMQRVYERARETKRKCTKGLEAKVVGKHLEAALVIGIYRADRAPKERLRIFGQNSREHYASLRASPFWFACGVKVSAVECLAGWISGAGCLSLLEYDFGTCTTSDRIILCWSADIYRSSLAWTLRGREPNLSLWHISMPSRMMQKIECSRLQLCYYRDSPLPCARLDIDPVAYNNFSKLTIFAARADELSFAFAPVL